MTQPELLADRLDGEEAVAEVDLGGDDALVVTPSKTLVYRAEGLLSDESVETYDHGAERVAVEEGRRKATISLDYGLDGEASIAVPSSTLDDALHPLLAGVLSAAGVTDPGETVTRTFRFSELTLVVTSSRLVKHVGQAAWDEDFEGFHYDDVTDLTVESGSVATSIVLTVDGRQERIKAPSEEARAIEAALTDALLAYHEVDAVEDLGGDESEARPDDPSGDDVGFGNGPDPLSADPNELAETPADASREPSDGGAVEDSFESAEVAEPEPEPESGSESRSGADADPEASASTETARSGTTPAGGATAATTDADDAALTAEVRRLRADVEELSAVVDEQRDQLRRQGDLIEKLVEELRRGR
ncbi:MAG: hypothetical protein ABEJ79_00785 [Halolamina sp.]